MAKPEDKVVLAYLSPGEVRTEFMESVVDLLTFDMSLHQRIVNGGGRMCSIAGANLAGPRNTLVKQFLDFGQADWLWMVDSDMTFDPSTLERLLEFADPDTAPIMGGLCFGFDEKGDIQPTLYGFQERPGSKMPDVVRYHEWPPDSLMQVAATGAACLLIHKDALTYMRDFIHPSRGGKKGFNDAYPWFQETEQEGSPVGEDITFCWRAGVLDIPVFVNTGVHLGHMKERVLTIDSYFLQRGLLSPTHPGGAL